MRLHVRILISSFVALSLLSCGKPKSFDSVRVIHRGLHMQQQSVNAISAASRAIERRRDEQIVFLVAGIHTKEQPVQEPSSVTPSPVIPPTVTVPATSIWDCIAEAERSGHDNPAMGPTYWTEYGVVIDVIQDYGTPEEQAAIFGGTADAATRLAPVARFAAKNGFGGWGELTKSKCGL